MVPTARAPAFERRVGDARAFFGRRGAHAVLAGRVRDGVRLRALVGQHPRVPLRAGGAGGVGGVHAAPGADPAQAPTAGGGAIA